MNINKKHRLTSVKVSVGLVGSQEHGLARIQHHVVEEVDGEAADVSGVLGVETQQQVTVAAGCVLPCSTCRGPYISKPGCFYIYQMCCKACCL